MFVDIHSHILPGIDDGCKTIEESIELLKLAVDDGVSYVVLTPHFIKNGEFKKKKKEVVEKYIEFKKTVMSTGIEINLLLGNELYIDDELDMSILNDEVCSLNKTSYVLIEFPFDKYKNEYDEILYNISLNGYRIIIAHPERYEYVKEDIDFCKRWVYEGYLLQCNQNNLFNANKKITMKLIKNGWVSFIASDAHGKHRLCELSEAYEFVKKRFSSAIADDLFYNNAIKMLNNKMI